MRRLQLPTVGMTRLELLAAGTILAAAAFTRLAWLNLMEFKADEAEATRLALHVLGYSEPGVGRFFPTEGLVSSVHIPNPPLFVYLIAVPLAVVRSPLAAAAVIAASNVVAVWLCYLVGKRYYSRFVGLASAGLLALSPWGIVFSRKIWAQDTLPIFTTLFLLQLHAFLVEKRPRAVLWLILIAAAATQIHFSAWILAPVLAAALVLGRKTLRWRWLALGLGGALLLYAPFLIEHTGSAIRAWRDAPPYTGPGAWGRFTSSLRLMLSISGGDKISDSIGSQPGLAHPAALVLGTVSFVGLVAACRRPRDAVSQLRLLVVAWCVLPLLVLTALPATLYIHYFIILFPLPFLGLAYAAETVALGRLRFASVAVAACLCCFAAVDVHFFRTIVRHGGAAADYGVGYRFTAEAAHAMTEAHFGQSIQVGLPNSSDPYQPQKAFQLLIWNAHPTAPAPIGPPGGTYVPVDTLGNIDAQLASVGSAKVTARRSYGPLLILTIG